MQSEGDGSSEAKLGALEVENRRLRERIAQLEARIEVASKDFRSPTRHRGPLIVMGLVVIVGGLLGASLYLIMRSSLAHRAPAAATTGDAGVRPSR